MLEIPAYLLGDFIIEIGLAGSIGLYKIDCFGSVRGDTRFYEIFKTSKGDRNLLATRCMCSITER